MVGTIKEKKMNENLNNSNENSLPAILTVPELSAVLRIGRASAYELVRCGRIRSLKIGRQLRVPRQAVLDFLNGIS